jgi:hypothetical protein
VTVISYNSFGESYSRSGAFGINYRDCFGGLTHEDSNNITNIDGIR